MSTGKGVTPGGGVVERTTFPRPPPRPCAASLARVPCSCCASTATAIAIAIHAMASVRVRFIVPPPLRLVRGWLHDGAGLRCAAARWHRRSAEHERTRNRPLIRTIALGIQRHREYRAGRNGLDRHALPRDVGSRAELHLPLHRLAIGSERRLALRVHQIEHDLRMAAAGNEAHQRATHRLGDRLIVHGEGMMRARFGRETCQAEPRERDQPTEVSSALCHRVLLCSLVVALNQPAIQRGHHALAGDDTGLSGLFAQLPITVDNRNGWGDGDWNRKVDDIDRVIDRFRDWHYEWLDVPAMLRGAAEMFEYPMIDRDPVPTWVDGHVALPGDAAHVMYPTGSNGASQAVMDAHVLGAALLEHGVTPRALQAYDAQLWRGDLRGGAAQSRCRAVRVAQPAGRALRRRVR